MAVTGSMWLLWGLHGFYGVYVAVTGSTLAVIGSMPHPFFEKKIALHGSYEIELRECATMA